MFWKGYDHKHHLNNINDTSNIYKIDIKYLNMGFNNRFANRGGNEKDPKWYLEMSTCYSC